MADRIIGLLVRHNTDVDLKASEVVPTGPVRVLLYDAKLNLGIARVIRSLSGGDFRWAGTSLCGRQT